MRTKKGQITIFVILGIILIIGAFLFFALQSLTAESDVRQLERSVERVDETYRPVQQYVEQCLSIVGKQGLDIIGKHGGYINPVSATSQNNLRFDQTNIWDSDGVSLTGSEDGFVAYWAHSTLPVESTTLQVAFSMPTLDEIRLDHENYINTRLLHCLNDFDQLEFRDAKITILDTPKTQVVYSDEFVALKTELTIDVNLPDGSSKSIEGYYTTLPVPFKRYYSQAKFLTAQTVDKNYLENMMLGLISYYGRVDFTSLPPFFATSSNSVPITWTQQRVNMQLQELAQTYVPALKIQGTKNAQNINLEGLSEEEKQFFNLFFLPALYSANSELEIQHIFLNWPVYSKVRGSDSSGELIKPTRLASAFEGTVLDSIAPSTVDMRYQFYYDITFPVIIEIRHEDNLSGQSEFSLLFAIETNVRANKHWSDYVSDNWPIDWNPSTYNLAVVGQETEFEDPQSGEKIPLPVMPTKKLFPSSDHFISGNISVATYDAVIGEALPDVTISIGVGSFSTAVIGQTKLDDLGQAVFVGQGPLVMNGYYTLKKEGYLSHTAPINITADKSIRLGPQKLYKKETKNITIKVLELPSEETGSSFTMPKAEDLLILGPYYAGYYVYDQSRSPSSAEETAKQEGLILRDPLPSETIYIGFTQIPTTRNLETFSNMAVFLQNQTNTTMDLVPGRYVVSGTLMDDEGIVIPKGCQHVCEGFLNCLMMNDDEEYLPEEDQIMKPMSWGGLEFDEDSAWSLSKENTYDNNSIVLIVLKFPPPTCFDDLNKISELQTYSMKYRNHLLPLFISEEKKEEFNPPLNENI
jgi:hypothetical protein